MSSKSSQNANDGFSTSEIKKAVTKKNFSHPLTLFPASAGLATTIGAVILGGPVMWAMTVGLLGLGALSWCANQFLRFEKLAASHMTAMREEMRKRREAKIQLLQNQLGTLGCSSGSSQLSKLHEKYQNFKEVLDQKFEKNEFTYGRYLGMAEQVYLAGLDNLEKIALSLKSVSTIDEGYIKQELDQLEGKEGTASIAQKDALVERLKLIQNSNDKVENLLAQNEMALTQLVTTASKLTDIDTAPGQSSMAMDQAMEELGRLTSHMSIYDRNS